MCEYGYCGILCDKKKCVMIKECWKEVGVIISKKIYILKIY